MVSATLSQNWLPLVEGKDNGDTELKYKIHLRLKELGDGMGFDLSQ
jgi:hypothetical protein